jgi:uncharacterized membrane protein YkoI
MTRDGIKRIVAIALMLALPVVVWSDSGWSNPQPRDDEEDDSQDHVKALDALRSGRIVPISKILDYLEQTYRGSVVEIELESEVVPMIYEVEYLTDEGNFLEFDFDATTGAVRAIKGTGIESARKKP